MYYIRICMKKIDYIPGRLTTSSSTLEILFIFLDLMSKIKPHIFWILLIELSKCLKNIKKMTSEMDGSWNLCLLLICKWKNNLTAFFCCCRFDKKFWWKKVQKIGINLLRKVKTQWSPFIDSEWSWFTWYHAWYWMI